MSAEHGLERGITRSFTTPDEVVALGTGATKNVTLGEFTVGRVVLPPGWRWSEQVRPVAGTPSCQFRHVGVALSGAARFRMDDGHEFDINAGDVFDVPPGHDNWVLGDDPAVAIVWSGSHGFGKPLVGDRVLVTLLMTDIAGSTDRLAKVGDKAWERLLDLHNSRVRAVLERYRAVEIDTTGDGFLATVDGAARAVQAAVDIRATVREIGLDVRIGVHTAEVEVVPGRVRGLGVHETARIMGLATGGEILVSSTTRELAAGAGLGFEDHGTHQLKGIADPRHLYRLTGT